MLQAEVTGSAPHPSRGGEGERSPWPRLAVSWCKQRAVATCVGEAEEGSQAVTASTLVSAQSSGSPPQLLLGKPAR